MPTHFTGVFTGIYFPKNNLENIPKRVALLSVKIHNSDKELKQ